MLSRVADAMYWMSRYVERVENLARFIDVTLNMILDLPVGSPEPWQPLVSVTGDHDLFAEKYGVASQESVQKFLTFEREYPYSILSSIRLARENARSIRETITTEMWEQLNQFYYLVRDASQSDRVQKSPAEFYRQIRQASHLFQGITDHTMSHGEGWHFANLGRLLERADKTSRILDVKYFILLPSVSDVGTPIDDLQWSAVLRSVSGLEMYRQQYHGITPERVVEFLTLNREFPRAVHYCVIAAEMSLHAISGTPVGASRNLAERRMGLLRAELSYAQVQEILTRGLHEFLDALQTKINNVGEGIYDTFITLKSVPVDELMLQTQL
ncbi:MAG: alpha-E domain-containing protein [Planctomycetaceae bacterium]